MRPSPDLQRSIPPPAEYVPADSPPPSPNMVWALLATALAMPDGTVPIGTTAHLHHETELRLELTGTAPTGPFTREIHRQQEQTSAVRPTPEGFTVSWSHNRHRVLEPGHTHDRVLPVVGQSYRVEPAILRLDGSTPTTAERDTVAQVHLLDMLRTLRGMWTTTLAVGATAPAGDMFLGMMHEAPGPATMKRGTLTVRTIADGIATVDLDLVMTAQGTDERGVTVLTTLTAKGLITLELATGWTRRFEVDGTVSLTAQGMGVRSQGVGTYRNHVRLDYR